MKKFLKWTKKEREGFFTIESTYISVFIFFSVLLLIYVAFTAYNMVVLTGNGYLAVLRISEKTEITNEKLEQELLENAKEISEKSLLFVNALTIQTKVSIDEIMVTYGFKVIPSKNIKVAEIFNHKKWEKLICCASKRVQKKQTLRLMKGILTSIEKSI